jgi:hypothetical protein
MITGYWVSLAIVLAFSGLWAFFSVRAHKNKEEFMSGVNCAIALQLFFNAFLHACLYWPY